MNDKRLINQIQQGDSDSLDILIRKYYHDVYSYILRRTANSNIAADLTQEAFLRLAKYINNYVHKGKFRNYLFTIARNTCNDFLKKDESFIGNIEVSDVPDTENNFTKIERSELILKALSGLPDIQKDVIILRFYHDMKVKDIAKISNLSLPTTKSRLKQGLDKLKKIMKKEDLF